MGTEALTKDLTWNINIYNDLQTCHKDEAIIMCVTSPIHKMQIQNNNGLRIAPWGTPKFPYENQTSVRYVENNIWVKCQETLLITFMWINESGN